MEKPLNLWQVVLAAAVLIIPGWLIQDPTVLSGDALAGLILVLTASYLIVQRFRAYQHGATHRSGAVLAFALIVLGCALALAASLAGVYRLNLAFFAMSLMALGVTSAIGGARLVGRMLVPILVLYLLVPLIPFIEAALTYPMRRVSAILAASLLSLGPNSVDLMGTEIYVGDLTVSVTSACDGLTLLQNMGWIAWWTVLNRHKLFWYRFSRSLIAIPAVIIANTLRIVVLSGWASLSGPQVLASAGHMYISWATVAVAAALFIVMEGLFAEHRCPRAAQLSLG